eukprot:4706302-Amphidinium_carterae.3
MVAKELMGAWVRPSGQTHARSSVSVICSSDVMQQDVFSDKDVMDIGCNAGFDRKAIAMLTNEQRMLLCVPHIICTTCLLDSRSQTLVRCVWARWRRIALDIICNCGASRVVGVDIDEGLIEVLLCAASQFARLYVLAQAEKFLEGVFLLDGRLLEITLNLFSSHIANRRHASKARLRCIQQALRSFARRTTLSDSEA